jgi:predicted lipoprotein with Yx(FWY)xxD motif
MMKGIFTLGVVALILLAGFLFLGDSLEQPVPDFEPYRATLTGEYLCLPHVNTDGPQTLECALGLQAEDGTYYAVDFGLMSTGTPDISTGERITASGTVTPVERLSSDHWRQYPIVGIFSVTDSLIRHDVEANFEGESTDRGIMYVPDNLLLGTDGNDTIGTYLVGFNGQPVYTFDNDDGGSDCINACAETWPPYLIEDQSGLASLKAGVTGTVGTITRADGSFQVIYNGKPLYFYREDGQGEMKGDGVNNVWHVAKP